jgi:hypothetical protein
VETGTPPGTSEPDGSASFLALIQADRERFARWTYGVWNQGFGPDAPEPTEPK